MAILRATTKHAVATPKIRLPKRIAGTMWSGVKYQHGINSFAIRNHSRSHILLRCRERSVAFGMPSL